MSAAYIQMHFSLLTMETNNTNSDQPVLIWIMFASEQKTNYPEWQEKGNSIAALKRHCIGLFADALPLMCQSQQKSSAFLVC